MKSKSKQKTQTKTPSNGPAGRDKKRKSDGKEQAPPTNPLLSVRRLKLDTHDEIYKVLKIAINDRRQGLITCEEGRTLTYMLHEAAAMRSSKDVQSQMDRIEEMLKRTTTYGKQPV